MPTTTTGSGSARLDKPPAVFCDFDDTVALQNVASLVLDHFGDSRREGLRNQYINKALTFREYQEQAFRGVSASREEMAQYVQQHAQMRPGFRKLWYYCRDHHIPLSIVTLGLDFYVKALLEKEGLEDVPAYCAHTSVSSNGLEYHYPHTWDSCVLWGTCKCSVLESYRSRGYCLVYVGDGISDFCPASRADVIFARSLLIERCRQEGLPYYEFEDFFTVQEYLQQQQGGLVR